MGKIFNALERHKEETSTKTESLYKKRPRRLITEDPETSRARDFGMRHEISQTLVVLSEPDSVYAENFKILRSKILFPRDRKRSRTIIVLSAFPAEGKTFVAANLAVSIALGIDEHVLLVDCDLRRPRLHEMLGYTNAKGLREYLAGQNSLEDLIIRTEIDKVSMLTAGNIAANPAELLSSAKMEAFLEEVKGRYKDRFIVLDSAPSQPIAEANVLAKFVDGIILVVMAYKTPRDAIQKTIHNLGKEKILGVVLNNHAKTYKSYYKYYKAYYK